MGGGGTALVPLIGTILMFYAVDVTSGYMAATCSSSAWPASPFRNSAMTCGVVAARLEDALQQIWTLGMGKVTEQSSVQQRSNRFGHVVPP